ncbi:haloacid dehalogenase type II [Halobacillus campisalis]|uniref:Haloacid dehalogenase type II n=1 Tax=Halobacillus campisalis TaxID=435909 RepID=A0ABW2K6Y5_9BACI|nr:haloacid dehalogenase type II [Halobacillus campisalis]
MSYKAYIFDAYGTLFDVHSVMDAIHDHFPDKGPQVSEQWRSRQIHYFMVRQLIDGYVSFDQVTRWALKDALVSSGAEADNETINHLMKQYEKLKPYDEVPFLKEKHPEKELTIFSNGTKSMLKPLLDNNQLAESFLQLSADTPKVYKPHPDAYHFAEDKLQASQDEILFFSSNPWDVAGAAQYGFDTAWVNRNEQKWPELGIEPTHILHDLTDIPSKP